MSSQVLGFSRAGEPRGQSLPPEDSRSTIQVFLNGRSRSLLITGGLGVVAGVAFSSLVCAITGIALVLLGVIGRMYPQKKSEHDQLLFVADTTLFAKTKLPRELLIIIKQYADNPHSFTFERENQSYCVLNMDRPYTKFLYRFSAMEILGNNGIPLVPQHAIVTGGGGPNDIVQGDFPPNANIIQLTDRIQNQPILVFGIRHSEGSGIVLRIFMRSNPFSWDAEYDTGTPDSQIPCYNKRAYVVDVTTEEGRKEKARLAQREKDVLSLDEFFARFPQFAARVQPGNPSFFSRVLRYFQN